MLEIKKEGVLLRKTNLNFENEGVLNPGAIREGEFVHLFYPIEISFLVCFQYKLDCVPYQKDLD